jgi:glutathione S-transferase
MITIHGIFGSPFVRELRIALEEKGLPWDWAPFPLGAQKQEPYISLHPFGKIPAIVDDGFVLYESQAILRHIDRKAPAPALIPGDPRQAARMDQLLCIVDCYLWPTACRPINFNRLIAPRIGLVPDEQAVADGVPLAEVAVRAIADLQGGHRYLAGDTLSLADIAVVVHLDALAITPEGAPIVAAHPGLVAWLAEMRARPSVRNAAVAPEKLRAA